VHRRVFHRDRVSPPLSSMIESSYTCAVCVAVYLWKDSFVRSVSHLTRKHQEPARTTVNTVNTVYKVVVVTQASASRQHF
jgi:hypothetical protein